jgi:hypothetical protein
VPMPVPVAVVVVMPVVHGGRKAMRRRRGQG